MSRKLSNVHRKYQRVDVSHIQMNVVYNRERDGNSNPISVLSRHVREIDTKNQLLALPTPLFIV